ncbi:hypothetical protein ACFW1A_02350 [Kitasatospora sp. NPDC058965]|uniref:hypothetical protein n=1 Tax=Kitasatospora sp. NPDC058965 TaxID=3346682 RepID=UPI0036C058C5
MLARRLTATALVLTAAALTLTACGPDESPAPAAAGSPTASVTAVPSVPAAPSTGPAHPASPSAKPSAKPTAKPSGTAKPTADCTAAATSSIGRVVESVDSAYTVHVWMKAKETKFVCGPDVPNDGYFEGYGNPAVFTFSNDAKYLLFADMKPTPVSLDVFMKHMEDCRNNPSAVQQPYSCYGGMYAITTTGGNTVTSITELFHP